MTLLRNWLLGGMIALQIVFGQSTIVTDGLNNSSSVFTITGGAYYTGSSASTDRPASSPFAVEGTHAYGVSNTTATMTSGDINTSGYTGISLTFRLAAFSINSTGNGVDAGDSVRIDVSPDGGTNYYSTVKIAGNTNAYWAYSTGTGTASTAYDGNTTPVSFTPAGGAARTTDGYSTVTVTALPSAANLRVRIVMINNSANERWLVDDFKITGTIAATPTVTVDTTSFNGAFGSVENGSNSTVHSFTVSGTGLSSNLVVTAPTGFQVSPSNSSGFGSTVSLTPTSNAVSTTTIYARFSPGSVAAFADTMKVTATGAVSGYVLVNGTGTAAVSPNIVTVGTFSSVSAQTVNTSSTGQEILVQGLNLTTSITVTAPSHFEVSQTSASAGFGSSQSLTSSYNGSIWIRFSPTTASGSISGTVTLQSAGATTQNISVAGTAVAVEPTISSSVSFSNVGQNSFDINLSGGNGSNRIVVIRSGSAVSFVPTDAAAVSGVNADFSLATDQGSGNKVVYDGTGSTVTVTNLAGGTTYYISVFEYTIGTGSSQNYYATPGTANQSTSVPTYVWNATGTASWATASNWTPSRSTPGTSDVLVFNGGGSVIANNVPTQTIGRLVLSNNTTVTMQATAANLVTIAGGGGTDLDIPSGSSLILDGASGLSITLGTGATGSIAGSMAYSNSAHTLTAADKYAITVANGGSFTQGVACTGNVFGTSVDSSVIFSDGAHFYQVAGSQPFGGSGKNVAVFSSGSSFHMKQNSAPSLSGRTYGHFIVDSSIVAQNALTGSSVLTMTDVIVNAGAVSFNLTGGITIKGNITVASGATLGFSPTSGTINLNGTASQSITSNGGLTLGSGAAVTINNSAGIVVTDSLIYSGSLTVSGTGKLSFGPGTRYIGGAGSFTVASGATLSLASVNGISSSTTAGNVRVSGTRTLSTAANYELITSGATSSGALTQITGTGFPATVNNFTVNNTLATDSIFLSANLTVNGTMTMSSGNFRTATNTLTLGSAASLTGETAGRYIIGTLAATKSVGTASSTLGGVGVSLNAGADDLGNVTVTRVSGTGGAVTVGANTGINRKFTIASVGAPAAGRSVTLTWVSDDDNNKALASGTVWKSVNSGTSWSLAASGDYTNRSVTLSGQTSFGMYTVSDASTPLPVEIVGFSATPSKEGVTLAWKTATELNNHGFTVERRSSGTADASWTALGFVDGHGTTNAPHEYRFLDAKAVGSVQYRLKQIDRDGSSTYGPVVEATALRTVISYALDQNYPNPFNPSTTISYQVPAAGMTTLAVYDMLGREVATLVNEVKQPGEYTVRFDASGLASGIYYYVMNSKEYHAVRKMQLLK